MLEATQQIAWFVSKCRFSARVSAAVRFAAPHGSHLEGCSTLRHQRALPAAEVVLVRQGNAQRLREPLRSLPATEDSFP